MSPTRKITRPNSCRTAGTLFRVLFNCCPILFEDERLLCLSHDVLGAPRQRILKRVIEQSEVNSHCFTFVVTKEKKRTPQSPETAIPRHSVTFRENKDFSWSSFRAYKWPVPRPAFCLLVNPTRWKRASLVINKFFKISRSFRSKPSMATQS